MNPARTRITFGPHGRALIPLLVFVLIAVGAAATSAVTTGPGAGPTPASPSAATIGIFSDSLEPKVAADPDTVGVELGVKFRPQEPGTVTALQYYQGAKASGVTHATLWSPRGAVLARAGFTESNDAGWRTVRLPMPVQLDAGSTYVVSYHAPKGRYPSIGQDLTSERTQNGFVLPAGAGVYAYGDTSRFPTSTWQGSNYLVDIVYDPSGTSTPQTSMTTSDPPGTPSTTTSQPPSTTNTPSSTSGTSPTSSTSTMTASSSTSSTPPPTTATTESTPPATGGVVVLGRSFPNAATTGVPPGTSLTPYNGPCSIQTNNVVIDKKTINCDLRILAQGVTITNSVINGTIYSDPDYFNGSFTLTDSEVRMPQAAATGIGDVNFVATRVEVTGGSRSINCAANCTVQDSFLHGQYTDKRGIDHESAIRMGAGSVIRHNHITCDATPVPPDAGCSAALTGYGDFAVVQKNTIDNNLIDGGPYGSMGYCAYGGSTAGKPYSQGVNNIKFSNNIFMRGPNGKCGIWGPITSFDPNAPGNVWTGNLWNDGATVPSAN